MELFLLLSFFILPPTFIALVVLLVMACVKKSWKLALLSLVGAALGVMSIPVLFFVFISLQSIPYDPASQRDLDTSYQADFGNLPPAGVTVLKARQLIFLDSGGQWLLLKATPEQIDKHIAMGFTKSDSTTFDYNARGAAPDWWTPPKELEFYQNDNWSKDGALHVTIARKLIAKRIFTGMERFRKKHIGWMAG